MVSEARTGHTARRSIGQSNEGLSGEIAQRAQVHGSERTSRNRGMDGLRKLLCEVLCCVCSPCENRRQMRNPRLHYRTFRYLFSAAEFHHLVRELRQSKDDRVDVQYYSRQIKVNLDDLMRKTNRFVLQIEEIVDGLNAGRIAHLQKKLKGLTAASRL